MNRDRFLIALMFQNQLTNTASGGLGREAIVILRNKLNKHQLLSSEELVDRIKITRTNHREPLHECIAILDMLKKLTHPFRMLHHLSGRCLWPIAKDAMKFLKKPFILRVIKRVSRPITETMLSSILTSNITKGCQHALPNGLCRSVDLERPLITSGIYTTKPTANTAPLCQFNTERGMDELCMLTGTLAPEG